MPRERLSMRKIREVLRLHSLGVSGREISRTLELGVGTVSDYLARAKVAGLGWPLPDDLDDAALDRKLFVPREENRRGRPAPDYAWIHRELRGKNVTLALLWRVPRRGAGGVPVQPVLYLYRRWVRKLALRMRQEHRGGEKLFVDFSGDGNLGSSP